MFKKFSYSEQLQMAWTNIFYNSSACYNDRREYVAQFVGCAAALEYTSAQFSHCMHQNSCKCSFKILFFRIIL